MPNPNSKLKPNEDSNLPSLEQTPQKPAITMPAVNAIQLKKQSKSVQESNRIGLDSTSVIRRGDSIRLCDPYAGHSSSTRFNDHSSIGLKSGMKPSLTTQKPDMTSPHISTKKTPWTPCTPLGATIGRRSLNDSMPEVLFSRLRPNREYCEEEGDEEQEAADTSIDPFQRN